MTNSFTKVCEQSLDFYFQTTETGPSNKSTGNTSDEKIILLLAYQRVGSTFIGSIFDQNPDMLYIYEPLDGVYTHLYGIEPGWAVPMDIHFHWNGTYR